MGSNFSGKWRVTAARLLRIAVVFVMAVGRTIGAAEERAVKSRVAPVYPELAKRMKIMGVVKVEATVDMRRQSD